MRKLYKLILVLIMGINMISCEKKESDSIKFKNEYESLNGTTNVSGTYMRELSIDEDNPFIYITSSELIEKINNKETFYIYFGSAYCPWCRSVIEETIKVAKENGIKTIYYLDIWGGGDHTEVFRDKYKVVDGTLTKTVEGTSDYFTIIGLLDNVLEEYTVSDLDVGEKRIAAPNFVYIEYGKAIKLTTATSDKQTDKNQELDEEILSDEEEITNEFFNNSDSCDIEKGC